MKISILPKFDQFYEKSHTLKTPFAAGIVQFQFHCATAITGPAITGCDGPAITGCDLRLNSGSTLPSFRVYKFQENFRKSVKFHRNRYFLEWFCNKHIGIQKSARFEPKSRFHVFDADQGPPVYPESIFCQPSPLTVYCGSGGGGKCSETQDPCLASTIICPILGPSSEHLGHPLKGSPSR